MAGSLEKAQNLARFARACTGIFVRRLRTSGWKSAWVYLRCTAHNFRLRQRDKRSNSSSVACPCCGWSGNAFYAVATDGYWLKNRQCPRCESHERHRMFHAYLQRCESSPWQAASTLLHFAPERPVWEALQRTFTGRHIAADLSPKRAATGPDMKLAADLQRLPIQDASVDRIICFHVLEHLPDDKAALSELWRVLSPGGLLYVMVPIDLRLQATHDWGFPDRDNFEHFRAYSVHDFGDGLTAFSWEVFDRERLLSPEEIARNAIPEDQFLFRCRKSVAAMPADSPVQPASQETAIPNAG